MPRRPHKRLGSQATKKSFHAVNKTNGKIKKWVTRDDVVGDEEDQFHDSRDKILLEGENAEGREVWDDDEEVFGLNLDEESDDVDEDEEQQASERSYSDQDVSFPPSKEKKTKTKKTSKQAKSPSPSPSESEDSEESESWGKKKSAYYESNATVLASKEGEEDEEEVNEMEEREARRLQARMRDHMLDEDYGLLDDLVDLVGDDARDDLAVVETKETSTAVPETINKVTALRQLEKKNPETLALAREWDYVARELLSVQHRLDWVETVPSEALSLGFSHLHHQTLMTYVTVLAFFIHIRSSPPSSQTTARIKPVLQRLLTLKQALSVMEDLDFDVSSDEEGSEQEDVSDLSDLDAATKAEMAIFGSLRHSKGGVGFEGLEKLLRDADAKARLKAEKRTKVITPTEIPDERTSKNKKTKRTATTRSSFDLVEPKYVPTRESTARLRLNDDGTEAYGEATSLSLADNADKKARKRTLRFHTSRIESSVRRKEAGREKLTGDDDIPYRERKKEKEERLRREVAKSRGQGGEDLDVDEQTAQVSGKRKRDESLEANDEEGDDGYYELVKRAKKENKDMKKRVYEENRAAERMVVEDTAGGPRSLTRAILKNKGLTPKRSKSVRNPRVKKRERYEKAKKKVSSQKAVYRPGMSGKPYGGEESGITKVVKSVKLA